jgi:hypothetical protein
MYKSSLVTALAVLLSVGVAPALADQTPAPSQRPPEQRQPEQRERDQAKAAPIRGQLVSVNTDTKSLTVKPEQGAEVTIMYDESTDVTGAKDAAGLATMTNRNVTVHFREDATSKAKVATRIVVEQPK